MKNRNWLLIVSLWLNGILLFALAAGYGYLRIQQTWWEMEAPLWATYAGTMQCISDHEGGIARYYRMVPVSPTARKTESRFTGEREGGIEVWSWPWPSNLGEASRAATQAFVDAYNRRMKNFVKEAATRPADEPAAGPDHSVGKAKGDGSVNTEHRTSNAEQMQR